MNKSGKSFRKFLLLWSGQLISAIGSGLTSFGLGIYVFQQTRKASAMALVTLLAFMPSLLLSAFAGVLADRYDRRLLMILGDGLSALGLLFILICMFRWRSTAMANLCGRYHKFCVFIAAWSRIQGYGYGFAYRGGVTVASTLAVRKGLVSKKCGQIKS
ncbi:MFS transporter [Paenibacillus apiarius]|uniref:MFS transporter n=1 Tax=Paenibacillus apiarius TaxID=46240 RepID=UPI001F09EAC0|nr:MFS transporter [Paenibacillus apiarius]